MNAPAAPPLAPAGGRPRTAEPVTTALLAATTASVAIGLGRLFTDRSYLRPVLAAVAIAHGAGWLARLVPRRRSAAGSVAFVLSCALLAAALGRLLFPASMAGPAGLRPTGETWRLAGEALRFSWAQFNDVKAPVPASDGFVLAAAFGVWLAAWWADALAFRARLVAEALLPSGVLFVFAAGFSSDSSDRYRWPAVAAYVATAALFAGAALRARQRRAGWFEQRRPAPGAAVAGTVAVASLAAVAAVALTPRVEAFHAERLIDWRRMGGDRDRPRSPSREAPLVAVSPLVSVRTQLVNQSDAELFTVSASRPAYWRLTSLDRFDGGQWSASSTYQAVDDGPLAQAGDPGDRVLQRFRIGNLRSSWLPVAYRPVEVQPSDGSPLPLRFDAATESVLVPPGQATGRSYDAVSLVVHPTPTRAEVRGGRPPASNLELPPDFPVRLTRLAESLTDQRRTGYEKARALQRFFRDRFTYDLDVPAPLAARDLVEFVFVTQRGYCEQFASAFAAMARSIGIPARVAVGFVPGVAEPGSTAEAGFTTFSVRGRHAHAWPEVYLGELGWVAFEPTPGRGIPDAEDFTGLPGVLDPEPDPAALPSNEELGLGSTTVPAPAPTTAASTTLPTPADAAGPAAPLTPPGDGGRWWARWRGWLAVAALAVGGAVLPRAVRGARTGARRAGAAANPAARADVAWREAVDALSWAGTAPRPGETPARLAARVGWPALVELAAVRDACVYAATPPEVATSELAARRDTVMREAASRQGRAGRVKRWFDPRLARDPGREAPGNVPANPEGREGEAGRALSRA